MRQIAHSWDPISDLPEGWEALARQDLTLVHRQWKEEKGILKGSDKIRQLEERLAREWAIETGIIERLYTVERGVTESLIELAFEAIDQFHQQIDQFHQQGKLSRDAMRLIADQKETIEFVFDLVSQRRELTSFYIKELHQLLTRNQDFCEAVDQFGNKFQTELIKGAWKKLPNNPTRPNGLIHEYCPPEFVQDEIDQLLKWYGEHREKNVPVEVEAAWLHQRFTQIHPFQDGNGRVARALATLVFLQGDALPLVIRDVEHREAYLNALEKADLGDLTPLTNLFADIQINDFNRAIEFLRKLRGEGIVKISISAAERAQLRQKQTEREVHDLTERMLKIASDRLEEVQRDLQHQFEARGVRLDVTVRASSPGSETWWNTQIVHVAQEGGYWAELSKFRRWVQLRLRLSEFADTYTHIVISFHHTARIAGLMVANAFLSTSERDQEGQQGWDPEPLAVHPYTYSVDHRDPEKGFREWLESVLESGLDRWQSRI